MLAEAREFLPLRFCEDIVEFSYEDAADPADVQVLMDLGGTAMVMIAVCSLYFSFYLYEFVRTGQRQWCGTGTEQNSLHRSICSLLG